MHTILLDCISSGLIFIENIYLKCTSAQCGKEDNLTFISIELSLWALPWVSCLP